MLYNFNNLTSRRQTGSLKWEIKDEMIPMWVADMDFETAPQVIEALRNRVEHGIFGYNIVTKEWYEAISRWWEERHQLHIDKQWLVFCTGVVPAISSIVRKMTSVAENIVLLTPVYNIFFNSIVNNGRRLLESQLRYDGSQYTIDFEDLEEKLSNPQTTMMILCNPHNPIGKIWCKEELSKIAKLCEKHQVLVVSDEIHCDLTDPGRAYTPFASVSEWCAQNSITCMAPTKAFNLAGLQTAAVMIPNESLRNKVERGLNTDEVAEPNSFAVTATVAAYTEGKEWLEALRSYLYENKKMVCDFFESEIPWVKIVPSEATYLLWLDCKEISLSSNHLKAFISERYGVLLSSGTDYGTIGEGFLRMNIACSKVLLQEGLGKLKEGFSDYEQWMRSMC